MSKFCVYCATMRSGKESGIFSGVYDDEKGKFGGLHSSAQMENVSFLTLDPRNHLLYAIGELGGNSSYLVAFSIEKRTGALSQTDRKFLNAAGISHMNIDGTGRLLVISAYGQSRILTVSTDGSGRIGDILQECGLTGKSVNPERQEKAHPHSAFFDYGNRYLAVPDLGADVVAVYRLDMPSGKLTPHERIPSAPGSGPRHFAFHPGRKFAYMMTELSSEIRAYAFDEQTGRLTEIQCVSALPADYTGESFGADLRISPDGKTLFASNRGHNSVALFDVDPESGRITLRRHIKTHGWTRNIRISDDSGLIFGVDEDFGNSRGALEILQLQDGEASEKAYETLPNAFCIEILQLGLD